MSKKKRLRRTVTGRIVYDRAPHKFSDADMIRIFKALMRANLYDLPGFFMRTILLLFDLFISYLTELGEVVINVWMTYIIPFIVNYILRLLLQYQINAFRFLASIIGIPYEEPK